MYRKQSLSRRKKWENARNCKWSCENHFFFVIFVAFTLMAPNAKDHYNFNDLPRPHITAFGLRVRLVRVILRFIAPKTEDDAQCYWHCYWHCVGKAQLTATCIIERSQLPAQLSITSMALFSLPDIFVVRECHVTSDIDDKLLEFWILITFLHSTPFV